VALKDVYNSIKSTLTINNKRVSYSTYYKVITCFLRILMNQVAIEREKFTLPYNLGKVYIKKEQHKRPFHVRIDMQESEKQGQLVKYKVPILDDYYNKLVWERPTTYKRYKILPLNKFKKLINEVKDY